MFIWLTILTFLELSLYGINKELVKPHSIGYAPWREQYNQTINQQEQQTHACPFCRIAFTNDDEKETVLYRGAYNYVILNMNPYIDKGVHFLIVPYDHEGNLAHLAYEIYKEAQDIATYICNKLSSECYEISIFYNIGEQSGASIPDHLHQHIICNASPNYYNLIDIIENTTAPTDQKTLFKQLKPIFENCNDISISPSENTHHCYYCDILQDNHDEKNLIIHRGKYTTILFDHTPYDIGHVSIIPNQHYEKREKIPQEVLSELFLFTIQLYPLLLSVLSMIDIHIGMLSYGHKAPGNQHIKQELIPRPRTHYIVPIMNKHHIHQNMNNIYQQIVNMWKQQIH